jgi:hypothetical protein
MSTLLRIKGRTYQKSELSRVPTLALLKASEELPTLGLRTTWSDLIVLMKQTTAPDAAVTQWSETDRLWLTIITIWVTLNASGQEATLREAMDLVSEIETIEGPDDHQGKAKAPASRKGSGRGGAPGRTRAKTRS